MSALRLFMLGSFRVERDGHVVRLRRRKVELLLAYLVLHPQEHSREQLAAVLWGDSTTARALASLRNALSLLRSALGPDLLLVTPVTAQLDPACGLGCDAVELQNALASPETRGAGALPAWVTGYGGDLLAAFDAEWIAPRREHLRAAYLDALLRLIHQARGASEYPRAVELAQRVLALDAANETAHQHLMFCYFASGQRQKALAQFEQCVRALDEQLAVEPAPETRALYEWLVSAADAPAPAARVTNLPLPLTSFIGRQREIGELTRLVTRTANTLRAEKNFAEAAVAPRVVTLTGAGGCGKTRLAIQVAAQTLYSFRDGVWWIELALQNDGAVLPAIAKTLGIRETTTDALSETLSHALHARQMLMVLDNCEHLIDECARAAEMLVCACPQLQILATSREPLAIAGETCFAVLPLPIPLTDTGGMVEQMLTYASICLFVERARAVNANFELNAHNVFAVAQICQQLDGIPLALELAAARANALTPAQIAARLDDRFALLTRGNRTALPRQSGLRALVDWSYELLAPAHAALFRRLAVFAGDFTLEAVQEIFPGAPGIVADHVSQLVAKSLVVAAPRGERMHYRLLDTLRAYAREKLRAADEEADARTRHMAYFGAFAERMSENLRGAAQTTALDALEDAHENLSDAFAWAQYSGAVEWQLRLAAALPRYWLMRGSRSEGRLWLDRALKVSENSAHSILRARVLHGAGLVALGQGDYANAQTQLSAALKIYFAHPEQPHTADVLSHLGLTAFHRGDWLQAESFLKPSLEISRRLGYAVGEANALANWADVAEAEGDTTRAVELLQASLPLFENIGDAWNRAAVVHKLADIALQRSDSANAARWLEMAQDAYAQTDSAIGMGLVQVTMAAMALQENDVTRAERCLSKALPLLERAEDPVALGNALEVFAAVARHQTQYARATRLLAAASSLFARTSRRHAPLGENAFAHLRETLRVGLPQTVFENEWRAGSEMTRASAITYALSTVE